MLAYCARVWETRYFWLSLTWSDLRTRYRRSILGMWWSLLNPILMTLILCYVFAGIFNQEIKTFAPYLLAGLSFWNYFSGCVLLGCRCFHSGESYIRQYPAPLAIYSLRVTLGLGFHLLLALSCVIVMRWVLTDFSNIPALWSLVPALLILFAFGWTISTISGFLNVHFPDMQHLLEVGMQMLFYATPVMYPAKLLTENKMGDLIKYNPLLPLLEIFRDPILYGTVPNFAVYRSALITVLVLCLIAISLLRWCERRLIFYL